MEELGSGLATELEEVERAFIRSLKSESISCSSVIAASDYSSASHSRTQFKPEHRQKAEQTVAVLLTLTAIMLPVPACACKRVPALLPPFCRLASIQASKTIPEQLQEFRDAMPIYSDQEKARAHVNSSRVRRQKVFQNPSVSLPPSCSNKKLTRSYCTPDF